MLLSNKSKGDIYMPDYILLDDIVDEMLDNVSYIKLKSHLQMNEDK